MLYLLPIFLFSHVPYSNRNWFYACVFKLFYDQILLKPLCRLWLLHQFSTLTHTIPKTWVSLPIFVLTKCIPSWFVGQIILNSRGSLEQWDKNDTCGFHLLFICECLCTVKHLINLSTDKMTDRPNSIICLNVFSSAIAVSTQKKLIRCLHVTHCMFTFPVSFDDELPLHFRVVFFIQQTQRNMKLINTLWGIL